uniref:Retrotransposon gag domain-containing protein n=1 Tax=Ananas comosus var. bracteatus TaxID=296719 RepID=A0A6V7QVL6_ANACO
MAGQSSAGAARIRPSDFRTDRASAFSTTVHYAPEAFSTHWPLRKTGAKIEIPNYDGAVDAEKLDAWLDQLEMYFDLYNYSNAEKVTFAKLKLVGYALTWWKATFQTSANEEFTWRYEEERWKCWHVLRQRHDQIVQDYTIDFRWQALALGISFDDSQVFRKYTAGLQEPINDELCLFGVRDITSTSQTAIAIERKNKLFCREKPSRESAEGSKTLKKKGSKKKKLPLEMRPKKKDDRGKRTTTTTTTSAGSTIDAPTLIGRIDQANTSLYPIAMPEETSLFQVKNEVIDAIIDPGSQKILISENLVQRLGLSTTPHPHPHHIQ